MKLGAADFIAKPFQTDALVSKIEGGDERRLGSNDPVIAYIQRHATQISTRHDVAGVMGLTLEQVSARVQMTTRHSFRQWLNTCRLQKATQLLKDTELEIARIALDTGFATVQHFSRVFSNIAGGSPRKYRQQNRQSAANDKQK